MITDSTPVMQTLELTIGGALIEAVSAIFEARLKELETRVSALEADLEDEITKQVDAALDELSVEISRGPYRRYK